MLRPAQGGVGVEQEWHNQQKILFASGTYGLSVSRAARLREKIDYVSIRSDGTARGQREDNAQRHAGTAR